MDSSQRYSKSQLAILRGIRRYVPFFVCLGIAAILWFTREMGKTYEETIFIPIHYENMPKSVVLISHVPESLQVIVEGTGWGLAKRYFFGDDIEIDVQALEEANVNQLSTKDPRVVDFVGEQLKVLDVYPQEITFYFEKILSKKVPIVASLDISYAQQYALGKSIELTPDSVVVYGAKNSLDTLTSVRTKLFVKKKVKKSFEDSVEIIPIRDVTMNAEYVKISAMVEKYTEQTITIPITLINVPKSVAVDLMRDKIKISFLVGLSHAQSYYDSDFEAVADYQKMTKKGMIPIEIVRYPKYVRVIHQDVPSVGIIINTIDVDE